MTKEFWLNLPVKNLPKAKAFFKALDFSFNEEKETEEMLPMWIGEVKLPVMLVARDTFQHYTQHPVTDTATSSEILISFDAESIAEVDALAKKVEKAGGHVFARPAEIQGWMYGFAFTDLDGHRWNAIYMDMRRRPQ